MDFELIDYSDVYFLRIERRSDVPGERNGKFVQIRNEAEEREYLVLSPKELSKDHGNIVERFCMKHAIEGAYNERKDYFEIHDGDWQVIGGGIWRIDEEGKVLELSGSSQMYGKFDGAGLKSRIRTVDPFSGYGILIDGL